jgi:hypothetical protein
MSSPISYNLCRICSINISSEESDEISEKLDVFLTSLKNEQTPTADNVDVDKSKISLVIHL